MNPAGKPEQPPLKRKRSESNTKALSEPSKTPKLDKDLNQVSPSRNPTTVNDAAETNGKSDLPILLDFTHANSTFEISARFDQLGTALLHDYQIVAIHGTNNRQSLYEVLELEFYLIKPGSHEDPFTHGSEEQRRSGRWYFHRAPTRSNDSTQVATAAGAWRTGSRKGMDITFGNPIDFDHSTLARNAVTRGGILLRSIRRVSDGKVTSGPSLLVDEILRATGAEDIGELVNKRWKRDISALPPSSSSDAPKRESALYFKRKEASSASGTQGNLHRFFGGGSGSSSTIGERKVYRSPRIGLDLSHSSIPQDTPGALAHSRANYIIRRYRFFSHPNLLTAKGQGHTFLGVYHFLLHSGIKESDEKAFCRELVKVTGMKEATVAKYWAQYKDGLHNGVLKPFLGQSGKGATSSPTSFLKLMGTLRKHQSRPVESTSDKAAE